MEMSDREVDRVLAKQALERDRREATERIADRYIGRDGSEPHDAERKAKAAGLTAADRLRLRRRAGVESHLERTACDRRGPVDKPQGQTTR